MKNPVTGYLIDVVNKYRGAKTVDGSLENYYKVLNCDCFDITTRFIGGIQFDIMCDDEGLLKDSPKVSAINSNGEPMLCGNIFIVKHDMEGATISLTLEELDHIEERVYLMFSVAYPEPYPVLTEVDYWR